MRSLTAVAWEASKAWLAAISIVSRGCMRCAIRRWLSGWIILSSVETWYQVGFLFHAVSVTVSAKVEPTGAFWVTAMTSASSAGRSWQKVSRNLSGGIHTYTEVTVVQVHPDTASMQKHLGIIGERAAQAYDETLDATLAIQIFGPVDPQMLATMRTQTGEGASLTIATEHLGGFTRSR